MSLLAVLCAALLVAFPAAAAVASDVNVGSGKVTSHPDPTKIEFAELRKEIGDSELILLDIRTPQDQKQFGKIPGSLNLPLGEIGLALKMTPDEFLQRYGFSKPSRTDQLTLSCHAGGQVLRSVPIFQQNGFYNLRLYLGSFLDWVKNKGEVERVLSEVAGNDA